MSLIKNAPRVWGLCAALVLAAACDSLNVVNPNAPHSKNDALQDPGTVKALAIGAMRTWYLTSQGDLGADAYPALTLSVMARSHVAAWNNYNIRFYTGCTNANWDVYTTATRGTCGTEDLGAIYPRIEWQNNPASAQRTQIEPLWYGHYAALSSANAVLTAVRTNGLAVEDGVELMAVLVQALSLSGLALNYDKGFFVDYTTDVSNPAVVKALTFSTRTQLRDSAMKKFDEAIALANAKSFAIPGDYFGSPKVSYKSGNIAQFASTMAARTLAYFPRNATENADISAGGVVDWTRVKNYAANGISSGTPFDLVFHQDACITWCDFLKVWSNDMTTMRVHTRVAHLLDPATQPDPWNVLTDTFPKSPDKRLGDGTFRGDTSYASLIEANPDTNCLKPVGCTGGTDFVWSFDPEIQNTSRGAWHQSAVGQIRYDSLPGCGDNPQGSANPGDVDAPMVLAAENDLLWAEALIRGPTQDLVTAADKINKSRVGRGGAVITNATFKPASAADGTAELLAELQYEQDVELIGSNTAVFYNQRRIDKLEPLTPHEMPVPAKELGVLGLALYTWGGASNPPNSSAPAPGPTAAAASAVVNAPAVWAELDRERQNRVFANRVLNRLTKN
jgi:hypothetical protein